MLYNFHKYESPEIFWDNFIGFVPGLLKIRYATSSDKDEEMSKPRRPWIMSPLNVGRFTLSYTLKDC